MGKKTIRFLAVSIIVVFVLCIVIFTEMVNDMHRANEESMKEVCQLYMTEMSHKIEDHFRSVMDLRLDMLNTAVKHYPPENETVYSQELVDKLVLAGKIRNYTFVAFYSEEGDVEILYGKPIEIINEQPFLESLQKGQDKLVAGVTETGENLLLFGINAAYPMKDGNRSLALLMGLPIEYINYTIDLDAGDSLVYSHIIRKDGTFVLRNDNNYADNYFDWLLHVGKFENMTSEQVVDELKESIRKNEDYSVIVTVDGQRRHIHCDPLKNTEWELVTVMLHGKLDTELTDLGNRHLADAFIACSLILAVLLCVYILYFRLSIRQMRSLEVAQQEAVKANQEKSQFLSNMSHDIRTPMNAIIGMTTIASTNLDKPDVLQDCLRKISLSSRHLLGLINDVLDMSKIESGKLTLSMREISLRDTAENLVNIIMPQIKEKKQVFDIFIHNIVQENVFCDDVRLNQVLINLLSNAIKFTPEGGSIYVTMLQEESPRGEKYVRTHIRVKDTGIGMSEEFLKTVFVAFSRENNDQVHHTEGTGLGMAITKHIVDEMQGTIEVESEQGKGTEFHVVLDLERVLVEEKDMMLPDLEVLVVDDDEQMCLSSVENLKAINARAEWAMSGEAAIDMIEKRHEENKDYQVILLDWQMPGMDGIETAKRLRERLGYAVPILMISAYDWSDVEEEARAAGINGFIAKPLFRSSLYYGLSTALNGQTETAEASREGAFVGENKKLLVAEDYDMNWEILATLLPDQGFELERAENGQICVEKFLAAKEGTFDAILMDLRMPVMNGYDATKAIRSSDRGDAGLPIIAMTADAFTDDVNRCLECGMNAHVAKPIDMNELLSVLKKFL